MPELILGWMGEVIVIVIGCFPKLWCMPNEKAWNVEAIRTLIFALCLIVSGVCSVSSVCSANAV